MDYKNQNSCQPRMECWSEGLMEDVRHLLSFYHIFITPGLRESNTPPVWVRKKPFYTNFAQIESQVKRPSFVSLRKPPSISRSRLFSLREPSVNSATRLLSLKLQEKNEGNGAKYLSKNEIPTSDSKVFKCRPRR